MGVGSRFRSQYLVGFGRGLPLFAALTVAQILIDPGDQAPRQRHAELCPRKFLRRQGGADRPVYLQNARGGILQKRSRRSMQHAHLLQHFAHVLRARSRGGLVGHRRDPIDDSGAQQACNGHQHERHGAVAADEILDAAIPRGLHDRQIHRIQDDDRIFLHAQRRGCVDPIALPTRRPQAWMNGLGVFAALGADEHGQFCERRNVVGVVHHGFGRADLRPGGAGSRSAEKGGFDELEILLLAHTFEEHRAHHAAPTDDADLFHDQIINSRAGGRRL